MTKFGPMSGAFPLHEYMRDTFLEAVGRGEIQRDNGPVAVPAQHDAVVRVGRQAAQLAGRVDAWDQAQQQDAVQGDDRQDNIPERKELLLKTVTTKAIYISRMTDLLVPPKVELKYPQVNFQELVYPRLRNPVLEVKQRDLFFSLTHCIYRNRARLFQQNRTEDNYCQNQACRRENMIHDVEHIFCLCFKVRAAWGYVRRKILEFLADQGRPPDVSNLDILLARFPKSRQEDECMLLLGTYVQLVDSEVVLKQKELLVNTVIGVLQAKILSASNRAVPQVHLTLP